jgi:hypothetical protein
VLPRSIGNDENNGKDRKEAREKATAVGDRHNGKIVSPLIRIYI